MANTGTYQTALVYIILAEQQKKKETHATSKKFEKNWKKSFHDIMKKSLEPHDLCNEFPLYL